MTQAPLKVVHMMRPASRQLFSIERVFEIVRAAMPQQLNITVTQWSPDTAKGLLGMLKAAWEARKHQGDITHITGDAHYLAWFLDPRRTILTVHDLRYFHRLKGLRRWLYWLLWFRIPLARCARVTAISTSTRDDLLKHAPWIERRLDLVVNPLPSGFDGIEGGHNARSADTSLQLLHIGTSAPKNLMRHLDAIEGMDAVLSIAGPIDQATREAAENHPARTNILGAVSDDALRALYQNSDILLFASLAEGFGLPILEAQAAGLPVIAGDNSAMPETAGGGALLVDAHRTDAIRDAIEQLANDRQLQSCLLYTSPSPRDS